MSTELRRSMGLAAATSMVVGIIVGASIFVQPSEVTRLVPNRSGVILAWLVSGVLTLCAALVCAELSRLFPETGGVYVFLKQIYSPALGFLWGWTMFFVMHAGILAAIAVVLARYAGYFLGFGDTGVRLLAMAAILFVSFIQYLGVKPGSAVQVTLTAAKVWRDRGAVRRDFLAGKNCASWRAVSAGPTGASCLFRPGGCCGTLRVRRLAHGYIFRRRNAKSRAHHPARADLWRIHCYGLLHALERSISLRNAAWVPWPLPRALPPTPWSAFWVPQAARQSRW